MVSRSLDIIWIGSPSHLFDSIQLRGLTLSHKVIHLGTDVNGSSCLLKCNETLCELGNKAGPREYGFILVMQVMELGLSLLEPLLDFSWSIIMISQGRHHSSSVITTFGDKTFSSSACDE